MLKNKAIQYAFINAGATLAYIIAIASFFFNVEKIFGQSDKPDTILAPIIVLLLFVISATVTGFLVLGRPIMWYVDGKKKEAVSLLAYTLVFLVVFAVFFISILLA